MHEFANDIELLKDSLQGRAESFEVVVRRYQSLVCAITYGATGSVDRSEELAQETFLLAWKNLRQLRDPRKFKAWLCRIARSVVQNWARARQHDVSSKAVSLEAASAQSAPISPPVDTAIRREQQAVVDQALESIPEAYRVPLILFYRENKSTREVAAILDTSENTARQRISRARGLLKDQVAAMVETTLAESKPGKAFTAAVVASLAGVAIKDTAAAAGVTAVGLSGLGLKIAGVAAGLVLVASAVFVMVRREQAHPTPPPTQTSDSAPIADNPQPPSQAVQREQAVPAMASVEDAPVREDSTTRERATDPSPGPRTAVPYEFRPQGVLSGLITDAQTGEPVRDAGVRLSNSGVRNVRTDEHGFYHIDKIFRPGNCTIYIDSNDYVGFGMNSDAPVLSLSPDEQVVRHFELPRACKVEVQVVDANGTAVEGAEVIPTSLADSRAVEINDQGPPRRTDPNGHILLGGFPPSSAEYMITALAKKTVSERSRGNGLTLIQTQLTHCPARAVVRLTDPNMVTRVTIMLKQGETLYGYAEYGDGRPAVGAKLGVQPSWWHCMSSQDFHSVASDGTFAIPHVAPGTCNILLATTNPEGLPLSSQVIAQREFPPAEGTTLVVRLPVASPETTVSISGHLVFEGGEEPDIVTVTAASAQSGKKSVYFPVVSGSRAHESFSIAGLTPGRYRLRFSGSRIEEKTLEDVTAPCTDLEVTLRVTAYPRLKGFVVDGQTGKPVERFEARLRKTETLRGDNTVPSEKWIAFDNAEGSFDVETVGPGVYQVEALADGYAPCRSDPVNTDENHDVLVSLSQGGTMIGRVIDRAGNPVDNAKVIPLSWACDTTPRTKAVFASEKGATVTHDGVFTLAHLPAGVEVIRIIHPNYAVETVGSIEIKADEVTQAGDIVLASGGTVEGFVLDELDNPLANQTLYFYDRSGTTDAAHRWATAVTDANGFYQVHHLPAQLCYVSRDQTMRGVARRAVTPREGETIRLDFGGAFKVSGVLTTLDGRSAQRRLRLRNPTPALFECLTLTGEAGYFTFSGIMPGTYELAYEDSANPSRWKTAASVIVANADLDLGVVTETASSPQVAPRPSDVMSVLNVSLEPCARRLSLKLPLLQPKFHWTFMSRADFLAGKLVVRIRRGQQTTEIVVFENGTISQGWEAIAVPPPPEAGEIYFGFISSQPYLTAPGDELEIELHVLKDLLGIGALQTGVLPAGTYKAHGTYSLLTDEYKVPDALKSLPSETIEKLREMARFRAFLESWEPRWPLQITSEEGWLDPEQREQMIQSLGAVDRRK
jgi:RNA polymerase sigma factor (sigma-70 family)